MLCLTNSEQRELPSAADLLKPFSISDLLQVVSNMLSETRLIHLAGAFNV